MGAFLSRFFSNKIAKLVFFWAPILGITSLSSVLLYYYLFKGISYKDYRLVYLLSKLKKANDRVALNNILVSDLIDERIKSSGINHKALVYNKQTITLGDLDESSNVVAHLFNYYVSSLPKAINSNSDNNNNKVDTICLYLPNTPIFVISFMASIKLGTCASLINNNLIGEQLIQSITISKSNILIFGYEYLDRIKQVKQELIKAGIIKFIVMGEQTKGTIHNTYALLNNIFNNKQINNKKEKNELNKLIIPAQPDINDNNNFYVNGDELALSIYQQTKGKFSLKYEDTPHGKNLCVADPLCYIFTSGTTGLPKAALITQSRLCNGGNFPLMCGIGSGDIIYTTLPLYHSAGLMLGICSIFTLGTTVVLRHKFSVNEFWKDVYENKCTAFQYIGELCRYLLAAPKSKYDTMHNIRLAYGNGLSPSIWAEFIKRFNIPIVGEFYASTEGGGLVNTANRINSIGFLSPLIQKMAPMAVVRIDPVTGNILRDPKTGFAIKVQNNEPGEFLNKVIATEARRKVVNKNKNGKDEIETYKYDSYAGYANDTEASNKKLAFDVFEKGDAWYKSGDLLKHDSEGFLYFIDRLGDTFRWLGENVSCSSVEHVIIHCPPPVKLFDVNVYGVLVGQREGRAGMVAITLDNNNNDKFINDICIHLSKHVIKSLPLYSYPYFLRFIPFQPLTETFKLQKTKLRDEGFNIEKNEDMINRVYFLDVINKKYIPLTKELHQLIVSTNLPLNSIVNHLNTPQQPVNVKSNL